MANMKLLRQSARFVFSKFLLPPPPMPYLKITLTEDEKDALVQRVSQSDHRSSNAYVCELIKKDLAHQGLGGMADFDGFIAGARNTTKKTYSIRLAVFLHEAANERAKSLHTSFNKWVSNLIQVVVIKSPVLSLQEVFALKESNREMAAIGRNLNQISKKLNERLFESDAPSIDQIAELRAYIQDNQRNINAVVRASMARWGMGDE